MKDFIKRNTPVFVIGLITLLVFLAIIIAGQKDKSSTPILKEVDEAELITEHTYVRGNATASVTLVAFSDFECVGCKEASVFILEMLEKYPNDLRYAYRHFPQSRSGKKAATAAQIAGEQKKFWKYHDFLFGTSVKFKDEVLLNIANTAGLDIDKFKDDLKNANFESIVEDDVSAAESLGLKIPPVFYLNGKRVIAKTQSEFEELIDEEVAKTKSDEISKTYETPEPEEVDKEIKKIIIESLTTVEVKYTESGFVPVETVAYSGQKVRWTNTTGRTIKIIQTMPYFPELEGGIELAPEESFEFKMYKDRLWTYKEEETNDHGAIFIKKLD